MSLHHSFYDIYSQYLFDNFECYNVCVINQDITKHFQELADFAELQEGHSVLDMGCGNGQFLNFLHKKFNNIQTLGVNPLVTIKTDNTSSFINTKIYSTPEAS